MYEYKIIGVHGATPGSSVYADPQRQLHSRVEEALTPLAAQGWEVDHIEGFGSSRLLLVLRRPVDTVAIDRDYVGYILDLVDFDCENAEEQMRDDEINHRAPDVQELSRDRARESQAVADHIRTRTAG